MEQKTPLRIKYPLRDYVIPYIHFESLSPFSNDFIRGFIDFADRCIKLNGSLFSS